MQTSGNVASPDLSGLTVSGAYANIKSLAAAIGIDSGVVAKAIRMTLLSPEIVHKLILGEADLTMQTMRRSFSMVWETQKKELLR